MDNRDGCSTSFWFDPWHPIYILYWSGIPCLATVADGFSSPLGWYILNILAGWWDPILVLNAEKDKFQCIQHPSRRFSIALAWDLFRPRGNPIWWSSFIWNSALPPRYWTHLWLTSRNRLPTRVLLISYGRIAHTTCPVCSCRPDSVDHLFFACHISGSLASFWAAKFNLVWSNKSWLENLAWASDRFKDKSFHHFWPV